MRGKAALNLLITVALLGSAGLLITTFFPAQPTGTPIVLVEEDFTPGEPRQLGKNTDPVSVQLLFGGDVMQHRNQRNDDFVRCYEEIASHVKSVDLALANLEFPVAPSRPPGPVINSVRFNGSVSHLEALASSGWDVLFTSNNHAFDQGLEGVTSTLGAIRRAGMIPVGTAVSLVELKEPALLPVGDLVIGLVGYSFGVNVYPGEDGKLVWPPVSFGMFMPNFNEWRGPWRKEGRRLFEQNVASARKAGANFVVAYVHWGEEWHLQPTVEQQVAGHDLIDAGFDLVVGSHSHVLQGPEVYKGKLIAYSLGNLIADFQPWQTRTTALLRVEISTVPHTRVVGFSYVPLFIERKGHRVTELTSFDSGERALAWDLAQRILGPAVQDSALKSAGAGH